MFQPSRPSNTAIHARLAQEGGRALSYREVGATRDLCQAPRGYVLDRNRAPLGRGDAVFAAGQGALERWRMFDVGWLELCWPSTPVAEGAVVGVLAATLGLWSLSACRVVYVIDEPDRCGFGYGTLPDHVGRGEERFTIERDAAGRVTYEILAFSRPAQVLTRIGYPWMRVMQRRFGRDSMAAMQRAVRSSTGV